jgi:hypothetical protein
MQFRALIVNPDNWVIGEHAIKDVMIWATRDRPWYHIRTYTIKEEFTLPVQLKTNSWTTVEINKDNTCPRDVQIEIALIGHRIKFLTELHYRLQIAVENLGLSDVNTTMVQMYEFLIAQGIVKGDIREDAEVQFENKMRLLQDLNNIREEVITSLLAAQTAEEFQATRTLMERLFFTNILL